MNANLERLSENSVKLTVEVSAEEFDKALDLAFEKVVMLEDMFLQKHIELLHYIMMPNQIFG